MSDRPADMVAPADARPRRPWPRWAVLLAYIVFFALALGSIWIIDGHALDARPRAAEPTSAK